MTPDNLLSLKIDADLTEASLEDAYEILKENNIPHFDKCVFILSVASQNYTNAVELLGFFRGLARTQWPSINLNMQYSEDAWSLSCLLYKYNSDDKKEHLNTVFSEGA